MGPEEKIKREWESPQGREKDVRRHSSRRFGDHGTYFGRKNPLGRPGVGKAIEIDTIAEMNEKLKRVKELLEIEKEKDAIQKAKDEELKKELAKKKDMKAKKEKEKQLRLEKEKLLQKKYEMMR